MVTKNRIMLNDSGLTNPQITCIINEKEFGHFLIVSDINYKTKINKNWQLYCQRLKQQNTLFLDKTLYNLSTEENQNQVNPVQGK